MRKTLTSFLALACALSSNNSSAQAPEPALEEITVSGEFAGPGMWQVTHPDHPGHTLWIVGEPPRLPSQMQWRSKKVERVALQSQEILLQPSFGLKPDKKVGMFRMLSLVPAALKLRKNPDKATLEDLVPPETYARWLEQKKLYLGRDSGVEKMRPFLVAEKLSEAAFKELKLNGGGAWGAIAWLVTQKKIPVTQPSLEFVFKTDDLRSQIKAFSRVKLADEECFAQTVALVEAMSDKQLEQARARAWATGDLARLRELPPLPNPDPPCTMAIVNALSTSTPVPANLQEKLDELWFAAADNAVAKNESSLAFVRLSELLADNGILEGLAKRGYEILAPEGE